MPLSKEAQDLIKESIAIVREDRFERYVRDRYDKQAAKEKDKDSDDGKEAPPPKDTPNETPKRKSAWWGELDDGE